MRATPSDTPTLPRRNADFATMTEALDYAARGVAGYNFYNARGALIDVLPFRDLRDRAIVAAGRLAGAGLKPGDRVALLAATGADFQVLFFGALYGGIIPVPLPLPTAFGRKDGYVDQIRNQVISSGARVVFGPADFVPLVRQATSGLPVSLVGTYADLAAAPEQAGAVQRARADALCYVQYSSGSTRFPTGVAVTHANLLANLRGITAFGVCLRAGDRAFSWLPFFHDMGLVGFMFAPLSGQISTDFLATEDFARRPLTWLRLMSENGCTLSYAPSFGYELCGRRVSTMAEGTLGLDLSRWRLAGIGGEMIKPHVMLQFAEAFRPYGFSADAFCASYGLAESVLAISFAEAGTGMKIDRISKQAMAQEHAAVPAEGEGDSVRIFVSCGKVLPAHEVEIRDDDGRALGERRVGRLFARGPSIMQGYYNNADATAEAIVDGWLDTGDLAYWCDGEVVIVGRAKDMLILNGRNIWPQDIEWTVEHMEPFRSGDSAAIVLAGPDGADRPTILVQCRQTDPQERARLTAAVRERVIEAVGVACDVIPVPPRSLPKTSSGKLARSRAKAMYERGDILPIPAV
jgi:fatty-acyl-CoA synthase